MNGQPETYTELMDMLDSIRDLFLRFSHVTGYLERELHYHVREAAAARNVGGPPTFYSYLRNRQCALLAYRALQIADGKELETYIVDQDAVDRLIKRAQKELLKEKEEEEAYAEDRAS